MEKYIIVFLMAYLCQNVTAQVGGEVNVLDRDIFYLHYTSPNAISNDFNYQKWNTKFSFLPIKFNKLALFNTIGFDLHQFDYSADFEQINTNEITRFYNVNYSLFMNYKLSEKWSLNTLIAPFLLSNLKGDFSFNDFNLNGNVYVERTFFKKKIGYIQVGLGVGYMTLNGKTQIIPISQVKARYKKWSFVLGLPNAYVKCDIHKRHSLKILGDLNDFSANLSGSKSFSENNQKAVFTTIATGLEYDFWLTSNVGIMFKSTYTIWGDYKIRDTNNDSLFDFETSFNKPFISVGIKFNPIRNLQNSLNPL